MTDETQTVRFVRVFLADNSTFDVRLTFGWDAFVYALMTTGCVATDTVWANRSAIVKMVVLETQDGFNAPNVLTFPEPKAVQ